MLNREQHQEAVLDIVNKVDRLITDKTVRRRFTDHIDHFCKMVEDYGQALIPHIEKVERAGEKLKENGATIIPPYKKLLPPPKDWVEIYNVNRWGKPTGSDAFMCEYVLLAIIHDGVLEEQTQTYTQIFSDRYDGKWFQREMFRREVLMTYYSCFGQKSNLSGGSIGTFELFIRWDSKLLLCLDLYPYRPHKPVNPLGWFRIDGDRLKHLERAFEHVQTDLKPAETGENATPAKYGGIKGFFWKLYETTVKAFFDSLLGKSLPK